MQPSICCFVFSCSIGCVFEAFVGAFGHSAIFALLVVCSLDAFRRFTCLFMNAMMYNYKKIKNVIGILRRGFFMF